MIESTTTLSGDSFCATCGRNVKPLNVPHVSRKCKHCDKTVYLVPVNEEGGGVTVSQGETFTIPAAWLTLSLDPAKSRGRFFRGGIAWYVGQLLAGGIPKNADGLDELLARYEKLADDVLEGSEKLAHLNLNDAAGVEGAIDLLKKDTDSVEWWAMWMGMMVVDIRGRIEAGESAEAVVSACRLQSAYSMLMFKQSLEDHVWTGYRHNQAIYDIASASARTPEEAEKIQALAPTFENLSEDVLFSWVNSGEEIGPKIQVTQLNEDLLKALARYHLTRFERRRQEAVIDSERQAKVWPTRFQGAGVTAGIAVAAVTVMKALGIL